MSSYAKEREEDNFILSSTEKDARKEALTVARVLDMTPEPKYDNPFDAIHALDVFVWGLPIEWVPIDRIPIIVPPGGKYSSGRPYLKEEDSLYGNYEGLPAVVVRNERTGAKNYCCFKCPDQCSHCTKKILSKPIPTSRAAMFCKVDGVPCGKKIVGGCQDFESDGWKTDRETVMEFDWRKPFNPRKV